jgi:hypothetical protein
VIRVILWASRCQAFEEGLGVDDVSDRIEDRHHRDGRIVASNTSTLKFGGSS